MQLRFEKMIIIKLIQEILKKTQQEIANELDVSRQTISMWLSGYKISKKHIERINQIYNVPIGFIEKSQENGATFSKTEIEYIKKCLLDRRVNYNGNLFFELLKVINSNKTIVSSNFNEMIRKVDYSNIFIREYSEDVFIDHDSTILVIASIKDMDLINALKMIELISSKYNNSFYVISYGDIDSIKIVTFGGNNEVNN